MSHLTSGWNEFRKAPYSAPPTELSTPTGAIFGGTNKEITNTMMGYIHLYKEYEEKLVEGDFTKTKNFIRGKRKN